MGKAQELTALMQILKKCFWRQIGDFFVRALNEAFRDGELSATQKQGILTCIPKGDKNKEFIKELEANFSSKCCL